MKTEHSSCSRGGIELRLVLELEQKMQGTAQPSSSYSRRWIAPQGLGARDDCSSY